MDPVPVSAIRKDKCDILHRQLMKAIGSVDSLICIEVYNHPHLTNELLALRNEQTQMILSEAQVTIF